VIAIVGSHQWKELANIHLSSLPNDVLPSLGKRVVEFFYKKILSSETQKVIGYYFEGQIVGFILLSMKSINVKSIFFTLDLLFGLIMVVLKKPHILYSGIVQSIKRYPLQHDSVEISYFAIHPDFQGKGFGGLLVNELPKYIDSEKKYIQTKTRNSKLRDFYIKTKDAEVIYEFSVFKSHYYNLRWAV